MTSNEKASDEIKPGTGADNYSFAEKMPPQYTMPHRSDYDAASHVDTAYVPYRGQQSHGVDAPLGMPTPPDLILEKPFRDTVKPDKRVHLADPVDVRVVSYPNRGEIIRPRAYAINVLGTAAGGNGTYGPSELLFGRDLARTRFWLATNTPNGTSVYMNDSPDLYNAFPILGINVPYGPFYSQDALWVFTNSATPVQVFVYMEYSSDLVT